MAPLLVGFPPIPDINTLSCSEFTAILSHDKSPAKSLLALCCAWKIPDPSQCQTGRGEKHSWGGLACQNFAWLLLGVIPRWGTHTHTHTRQPAATRAGGELHHLSTSLFSGGNSEYAHSQKLMGAPWPRSAGALSVI